MPLVQRTSLQLNYSIPLLNKSANAGCSELVGRLTPLIAMRIPPKSALDIGWKLAYIPTSARYNSEKEKTMATKKPSKRTKKASRTKRLSKPKSLEATKPLTYFDKSTPKFFSS
jgi:hypothetical protein